MQYVNRRTGAIIDTECEVKGGEWEEVFLTPCRPGAPAQGKKPTKKEPAKRTKK